MGCIPSFLLKRRYNKHQMWMNIGAKHIFADEINYCVSLFMNIKIKICLVDISEGHIYIRTRIIYTWSDDFCEAFMSTIFMKFGRYNSIWSDNIWVFFIKTSWVYIWYLYLNQTCSFVYGLIKTYNKFRFHEIIIASCTLITRIHGKVNDKQMDKLQSTQNLIPSWSV